MPRHPDPVNVLLNVNRPRVVAVLRLEMTTGLVAPVTVLVSVVPPMGPPTAKAPVLGLKLSLVELTLMGRLPVAAVTQVRYMVALVVVSSVMVAGMVPDRVTGRGVAAET